MHVLFCRFPLESRYGGAEVQTMSLMRGLAARGHTVSFLGSCPTLLRLCREQNIPATRLEIGPPPVTKWSAVSFLWRRMGMRRKLLDSFNHLGHPDVVCMLSLSEKLLLTHHAITKGSKVFWIEHDRVGRWLTQNPWLGGMVRTSTCVKTVCVSELSRKIYLDLGWPTEKTVAIANGVDTRRIQACHGEPAYRPGRPVEPRHTPSIGSIARLTRDKGLDVLIEAIADLPGAHLTIVGEGPEEARLRSLVDTHHVNDRVIILSNVEDLGAFYRSLDLFVLPSREHDPFGLVAAEAMLCGVATIVTNACGIAGYLRNGFDALIAQADDPRALAEAIHRLSDMHLRERIAEQGQKTAEEKFRPETMAEAYEKLFTGSPSPRA